MNKYKLLLFFFLIRRASSTIDCRIYLHAPYASRRCSEVGERKASMVLVISIENCCRLNQQAGRQVSFLFVRDD